jgi:hypothetical protein
MEFQILPAIVAGFAGGVVMTLMMNMAKAAGMTEMDMAVMQGSMVTGDRGKAKAIGMFTHLVMMSAVVFGTIYALLFNAFGIAEGDAWWVGAAFGAVHGVIAGIAFAMMPAMHPRMGDSSPSDVAEQGLRLRAPGVFGKNYGAMTAPGMLMAHVLYGLVVGLVYAWLV